MPNSVGKDNSYGIFFVQKLQQLGWGDMYYYTRNNNYKIVY